MAPLVLAAFRQDHILFPVAIWAALRFDQRGVVTTTALISAVAIFGTASGRGPFVQATLSESLSHLQAFMAVTAVAALVLGAVFSERRRAQAQVSEKVGSGR